MNSLTPACSFLSIGKHQFSKLAVCQRLSFGNVLLNLYLLSTFSTLYYYFKNLNEIFFRLLHSSSDEEGNEKENQVPIPEGTNRHLGTSDDDSDNNDDHEESKNPNVSRRNR